MREAPTTTRCKRRRVGGPARFAPARTRGLRFQALQPWLLALGMLLLFGCEELGNPDLVRSLQPTRTEFSGHALQTRARSVPAHRADELLRSVALDQLQHLDPGAPISGAIAFVEVTPDWGNRRVPRRVSLITEFSLDDGRVLRRAWTAPARLPLWRAVFALPSRPTSATTSFLR